MNDPRPLSPFTEDAARLGRALSELTEHNSSLLDQLAAMDRAYHIAAAENELLRLALSEANRKADFNMRYATSLHTQLTSLSNDAILIASRVRDLLEAAKTAAYTPQPTPQISNAPKCHPDAVWITPNSQAVGVCQAICSICGKTAAEGSSANSPTDDGEPIPKFLTTALEAELTKPAPPQRTTLEIPSNGH